MLETSQGFVGILVTIMVLCIISDESNFLLRGIIIVFRDYLRKKTEKQKKLNAKCNSENDESMLKILDSQNRINKFFQVLYDKNKSGNLIVLFLKHFPEFFDATLYVLFYSIVILCCDELVSLYPNANVFISNLLLVYTYISCFYWIVVWLMHCSKFQKSMSNILEEIINNVSENSQGEKPGHTIFEYRSLTPSLGMALYLLFGSFILVLLFYGFCEAISPYIVQSFALVFIIANGLAMPFIMPFLNCKCDLLEMNFASRKTLLSND